MMKLRHLVLGVFLILAFILAACRGTNATSGVESAPGNQPGSGSEAQPSGPFRALATSAISVDLAWDPIEGATSYRIENSFADSEWFAIAEVGGAETSYEDFLTPSNMELNYRLTPLMGEEEGKALDVKVKTPEVVPNPYSVVATLEEPDYSSIGLDIPGFDPSTFDPSTFDPSTLDLTGVDSENLDLASLQPEPVSALARIGPEGGSLSVKGANGVIYTLHIPPDALPFTTIFVMTPVETIEGYPFSGEYYAAVQIRPEGIYFDSPVTLSFEFPGEEAAAEVLDSDIVQVAFAYEGGGEEFHLTPMAHVIDSSAGDSAAGAGKLASPPSGRSRNVNVPMSRSQTVGTGPARSQESHNAAANHATTKSSANADQTAAVLQIDDDLGSLDIVSPEVDAKAKAEYYRKFSEIYSAIVDAGDIFDFMILGIQPFQAIWTLNQFDSSLDADSRELIWDAAVNAAWKFLEKVECPSPQAAAMQEMVRRLNHPVSDFDKEFSRRFSARYGEAGKKALLSNEAIQSCKVKLILVSNATNDDELCKLYLHVKAEVQLSWHYDDGIFLQGAAPLVYLRPQDLEVNTGFNPYDSKCVRIEIEDLDTAIFTVIRLRPIFDGTTLTDWSMATGKYGWSVAGESTEYCRTTVTPPDDENHTCSKLPGGVERDLWGGLVNEINLLNGMGLGIKGWKLDYDPDSPDHAIWPPESQTIRARSEGWRGDHSTRLTLTNQ